MIRTIADTLSIAHVLDENSLLPYYEFPYLMTVVFEFPLFHIQYSA